MIETRLPQPFKTISLRFEARPYGCTMSNSPSMTEASSISRIAEASTMFLTMNLLMALSLATITPLDSHLTLLTYNAVSLSKWSLSAKNQIPVLTFPKEQLATNSPCIALKALLWSWWESVQPPVCCLLYVLNRRFERNLMRLLVHTAKHDALKDWLANAMTSRRVAQAGSYCCASCHKVHQKSIESCNQDGAMYLSSFRVAQKIWMTCMVSILDNNDTSSNTEVI